MSAADDRALKRELRARAQLERQAFETGLCGVAWEPEVWPDTPGLWDAYAAGLDERRTRRREARWALVRSALAWCGRHLAPRTVRRLRKLRRRLRRVRALTGEVRRS